MIHTIDDSFFIKLMDDFDAQRLASMQVKDPEKQHVTVIKELVDLIEAGIGTHQGAKGRFVSGLKLGATKRRKSRARTPY